MKLTDRNVEIARLYAQGETLESIGKRYAISRERVRQITSGQGLTRRDGGFAVQVASKRELARRKRDEECVRRWGMGKSDLSRVKNAHPRALRRYNEQRHNANDRGVPWAFVFATWWEVWERSGKWSERGRSRNAYVMARFGDVGPYAAWNVEIIELHVNARDGKLRYWDDVRNGRSPKKRNPAEAGLDPHSSLGLCFESPEGWQPLRIR